METMPPMGKLEFFLNRLVDYIRYTRVSYDRAFKAVTRKYPVSKWLLGTFYKIGYYTVLYYYGLQWIASRRGFGSKKGGAIAFFRSIGFSVRRLEDILYSESRRLSIVKRLSIQYSYPEYIVRDLLNHMDAGELEEYLRRLNERRIWFRVNTLKTSVDEAVDLLEKEGVSVKRDYKLPFMLRVVKPYWIQPSKLECVRKGLVIPQDKASALVSMIACSIGDGELLDACSAPGNKLSLTIMIENKASIRYIAVDKSWKRVNVIPRLLKHQGLHGYNVLVVNSDSCESYYPTGFSRAVVDAPCSGIGAVPSDPAVKLAIEKKGKLEYYHRIQYSLIKNTLRYTDYLVYAVCSIHPFEGEEVVEKIISKGYAELVETSIPLNNAYRGYIVSRKTYRTYPHKDYSQGFYIAILRSRK